MSKRRAHVISDSDEGDDASSTSPTKKASPRDYLKETYKMDEEENENTGLEIVPFENDDAIGRSLISFNHEDEEVDVQQTPQALKIVEAPTRASRKQLDRMFAFLIDRSPSDNDNLETFVSYIIKRKLADAFMRMSFDKNSVHHSLVMTCCDSETNNLSNREQHKKINLHCVELIETGPVKPGKIAALQKELEKQPLQPETEQFSSLMCGLMTAADVINRLSKDNVEYDVDLTVFSDLGFDTSDPDHLKMKTVIKRVLSDTTVTVVSDRSKLNESDYCENIQFFEDTFSNVVSMSYQDAMKKSEEWTVRELMPMKWNASIQLFGQEVPIEAYLICAEKEKSILENRLEKKDTDNAREGEADGFTAKSSTIRGPKQLVKLTKEGHYKKDSSGAVITVSPERTVMAYKFGTTAVISEQALNDYIGTQESHKGYVIKGWYPSHQFLLHLRGGKAYHVFSAATNGKPEVFDSLLQLCANQGRSLLVEYAYASRYSSKPGVLIPHPRKHCFVYYELIYQDNMNYLPRYDPIATRKPEPEHLKEIANLIAKSGVSSLEFKYDPFIQQIFESVWEGRLDEMARKFVDKFTDVKKDPDETSKLAVEASALADRAEGVVKRIVTEEKAEVEKNDKVLCLVEALDEKSDELKPVEFSSLFR